MARKRVTRSQAEKESDRSEKASLASKSSSQSSSTVSSPSTKSTIPANLGQYPLPPKIGFWDGLFRYRFGTMVVYDLLEPWETALLSSVIFLLGLVLYVTFVYYLPSQLYKLGQRMSFYIYGTVASS